jgi:chorismate mutase
MSDLDHLREQINACDQALIKALAKRFEVIKEISAYKHAHDLPPLDADRWKEVIESRITMASELGLTTDLVAQIYDLIHKHALEIEAMETK